MAIWTGLDSRQLVLTSFQKKAALLLGAVFFHMDLKLAVGFTRFSFDQQPQFRELSQGMFDKRSSGSTVAQRR
jgi:hypothetical protein